MTTQERVDWKVETVNLYEEPCNCGDQVRHNNGGNYHRIARLVTVGDGEGNVAVVFDGHGFGVIPEEWTRERDGDEAIRRFLTAEAMVLYAIVGGEEQEK